VTSMAAIFAARRLANWDGRPSPAFESAIADATAERIMAGIDGIHAGWRMMTISSGVPVCALQCGDRLAVFGGFTVVFIRVGFRLPAGI